MRDHSIKHAGGIDGRHGAACPNGNPETAQSQQSDRPDQLLYHDSAGSNCLKEHKLDLTSEAYRAKMRASAHQDDG